MRSGGKIRLPYSRRLLSTQIGRRQESPYVISPLLGQFWQHSSIPCLISRSLTSLHLLIGEYALQYGLFAQTRGIRHNFIND